MPKSYKKKGKGGGTPKGAPQKGIGKPKKLGKPNQYK